MRLSESKIKEAILHPDQDVRAMAVQYFADCFSQDEAVMPLFIQSVEKYGWQNAVSCFALRKGLAQTDDTLLWVLGELNKEKDPDDEGWQKYTLVLLDLLTKTDAHLLSQHQSAILNIERLDLKVVSRYPNGYVYSVPIQRLAGMNSKTSANRINPNNISMKSIAPRQSARRNHCPQWRKVYREGIEHLG